MGILAVTLVEVMLLTEDSAMELRLVRTDDAGACAACLFFTKLGDGVDVFTEF